LRSSIELELLELEVDEVIVEEAPAQRDTHVEEKASEDLDHWVLKGQGSFIPAGPDQSPIPSHNDQRPNPTYD
jgi:hypothetical protein